jgi:uncharacterized protein YggE
MRSQNIIFVLAVLALAGSLIYIGNNLDNRSSGTEHSISVMGEGKTNMAPDSMVISLAITELAATTQEAQAQSNAKVNQVKDILKQYNIPAKDIKTENVSVYEEFDWTEGGRRPLGYRSSQTLTITITDGDYTTIGGQIIDDVAKIGGVQVNNTYFALKDKNQAMAAAREEAFADAKAKAEQLANAAGLRVRKAISINDSSIDYYPGPIYPMYGKAEMAMDGMGGGADISAGEMEVRVQIHVVFEMK